MPKKMTFSGDTRFLTNCVDSSFEAPNGAMIKSFHTIQENILIFDCMQGFKCIFHTAFKTTAYTNFSPQILKFVFLGFGAKK